VQVPVLQNYAVDIEQYTVSKALEGLFHVLGHQESLIREDPAARVTHLLQEVFGRMRELPESQIQ
jgi:hypothetical protein